MIDLFEGMGDILNAEIEKIDKGAIPRCRTCIHRIRYELNDHSRKIVQCCELQRSKRSNSGYKTIKVTDMACLSYSRNNGKQ